MEWDQLRSVQEQDACFFHSLPIVSKDRRLKRHEEFLKEVRKAKKASGPVAKRRRVDYAMKELDKAWRDGMDLDLKEKSVIENFELLHPEVGQRSGRAHFKKSKLKKGIRILVYECSKVLFILIAFIVNL